MLVKELIGLAGRKVVAKGLGVRLTTLDDIVAGRKKLTAIQKRKLRDVRRKIVYGELRRLGIRTMSARRLRDVSIRRLKAMKETLTKIHMANVNYIREELWKSLAHKVGLKKMKDILDMFERDYWENIKKSNLDFYEWLEKYKEIVALFLTRRLML